MVHNIVLDTDSYKVGHDNMFRPGVTWMQYHFLSRGGPYTDIVFYGLHPKLLVLENPITKEMIAEAKAEMYMHLGPNAFNEAKWLHIVEQHAGKLPLLIKARLEGDICKPGEPLFTVESTCPACRWLPGHLETFLERVWYPTTIATQSRWMMQQMLPFSKLTSESDPAFLFRMHDFGGRSYTSAEAAAIGGSAHLAAGWMGTDTCIALTIPRLYGYKNPVAFSVSASEHSVVGTWGEGHESEYLGHLIKTYPKGILSVVADTFNYYSFVEKLVCGEYRDAIKARTDGPLVVRPDSGDPKNFLVWTFEKLEAAFGAEKNSKGYKVLDSHVRVILGDGIKRETLVPIIKMVTDAGWSLENIVFGCGSGLIQKGIDRDTLKVAYKANAACIDENIVSVHKNPVTDPGKRSIRGPIDDPRLQLVFNNGQIKFVPGFDEIRARAMVE